MEELIANYGTAALTWIMAGVGMVLMRYVFTLSDSRRLRDGLERAWFEVRSAVMEVGQTYIGELRKANGDGKLTDAEKAEAKAKAIKIAKSNIGAKGVKRLARIFDVDEWLGSKIETVIGEQKAEAAPLAKLLESDPS